MNMKSYNQFISWFIKKSVCKSKIQLSFIFEWTYLWKNFWKEEV